MKRALIPGSFDPVTLGHVDMVRRASKLFDEVYITVFDNCEKHTMFTAAQRYRMLEAAVTGIPNVKAELSCGFLADYVSEKGIDAVIKGSRTGSDYDYEYMLSHINRSLNPDFETLIMPSRSSLQHISSTMARECIRYGKTLAGIVPPEVEKMIREIEN